MKTVVSAIACLLLSSCCSMQPHPVDAFMKTVAVAEEKPVLRVILYPVQLAGIVVITPWVFICLWDEAN